MEHQTFYIALMIIYLLFAIVEDKQKKALYVAAAASYAGLAFLTV